MATNTYPTLAEVEAADLHQLQSWCRKLPAPGQDYLTTTGVTGDFFSPSRRAWNEVQNQEQQVLERITERRNEMLSPHLFSR